jgi:hypothetical protein
MNDSYANAVSGCLHAGEGAGRACMNDLVVKFQRVDFVDVILWESCDCTLSINRKSRAELPSLFETISAG